MITLGVFIMRINEQLRYVRRKLRLTQEQLSQQTGISKATIVRWENGNIEPQMVSYGKFVDFCEKNGIEFKN